MLYKAFLILILFSLSPVITSAAEQKKSSGSAFEPGTIHQAIKEQGVYAVLASIANDPSLQETLQRNLRAGKADWLDLFLLLRDHPEAEQGSMLDLHLAYAVGANPDTAFKVIHAYQDKYNDYFVENGFPHYAKLVCGNVDQDWKLGCEGGGPPGSLAQSAVDTLVLRLNSVRALKQTQYQSTRTLCLEKLETTKAFWDKLCK